MTGLSQDQVNQLIKEGKSNFLSQKTSRTYRQIFVENFFNFVNNLLYLVAFLLLLVSRIQDALVTVSIVLINVLIGVIQEVLAKRKLDSIALLSRPIVTVLRDLKLQKIDPVNVVLGDIIYIQPGNQLPVDGLIIDTRELQMDESQLTGESDLVFKKNEDQIFSGSFCIAGSGYIKVTAVGQNSLVNKLTEGAKKYKKTQTPLQKDINLIFKLFFLFIAFFQLLFIVNKISLSVLNRTSFAFEDLIWQSGVLVGLIPNSLLLMTTVAYSLGAAKIAGKGALVQQLNAIESLSNVDIVCMDKTGTLTTGELELVKIFPEISINLVSIYAHSATNKNKTIEAITKNTTKNQRNLVDEISFTSKLKWGAIAFEKKSLVLGAPDILLSHVSGLNPKNFENTTLEKIQQEIVKASQNGYRVLILGSFSEPFNKLKTDYNLGQNLQLESVIFLKDKLRANLKSTLEKLESFGIDFRIISGDNPHTVAALVKQTGISKDFKVVSGLDLKTDKEIEIAVENNNVFGRITPEQKQKIVGFLNQKGYYTAMIGDGVNDVLSLKEANLGIAMESGSQATRNVADIILLKDDFGSIPEALIQGQKIRAATNMNAKLFVSRVTYIALLILSTSIITLGFPLTIAQNSLTALLTAGIPSFFLTIWAKPEVSKKHNFLIDVASFVAPIAILLSLVALFLYSLYLLTFYGLNDYLPNFTQNLSLADLTSKARGLLTIFLIFAGISVVFFIYPPSNFWITQKEQKTDLKIYSILILILIFYILGQIFGFSLSVFQISGIVIWDILYILIFFIIWIFLAKIVLKNKILEKFLYS
jgi:cation-transporting ATPase E